MKKKIIKIKDVDKVEKSRLLEISFLNNENQKIEEDLVGFSKADIEKYKKYLKLGTLDYDILNQGNNIIINNNVNLREYDLNPKVGDDIMMSVYDGDNIVQKEFHVAGIIQNENDGGCFFHKHNLRDELQAI